MKRDLIFPTEVWHEDATWMSQIYDTPYLLDRFQEADDDMIHDFDISEHDVPRDEDGNLDWVHFPGKDFDEVIRYIHNRFEYVCEASDYKEATGLWPRRTKWNIGRDNVIQTHEGTDWCSMLFLKVPEKKDWPGYATYGNRMIFRDPRHRSIMAQERFVNTPSPSQRTKWELEIKENMLVIFPGYLEYYMEGDGALSITVDWKVFNYHFNNRRPTSYSLYWDAGYNTKYGKEPEYKFAAGLGQHLKKDVYAETTPPEDDI